MRKRLFPIFSILLLIVVLSGCTQIDQPIDAESTGIWNSYFVYPVSQVIQYFADLFNSYGISIIAVTLIIRSLLLPLNIKQLKSTKAMQDIQPKMKELQAKYSSKDANTQQKLQKETMSLFQEHGVNPLAGCLPIIVQMPILLAIFHAIRRTEAIGGHEFLWFTLDSPDPVLPFIAGAATYLQQRLMMAGNPASQNPQMVAMLYIMPIMLTIFAFFFPSALALYWVVGNIFMVAQTIFIRKPMMKDANTGGTGGDNK